MPRAMWPLLLGRPTIEIALSATRNRHLTVLGILADTGGGSDQASFELVLEESDCLAYGNVSLRSVQVGGAFSGLFQIYTLRVQIPQLAFSRRIQALGVPRGPSGFSGIACFRFLNRFTYGNFGDPTQLESNHDNSPRLPESCLRRRARRRPDAPARPGLAAAGRATHARPAAAAAAFPGQGEVGHPSVHERRPQPDGFVRSQADARQASRRAATSTRSPARSRIRKDAGALDAQPVQVRAARPVRHVGLGGDAAPRPAGRRHRASSARCTPPT